MDKNNKYEAIDAMTEQVWQRFGKEHRVSRLFENCISNTLNTTVRRQKDGSVFLITGDIPAMWLRDSSCQMRPFLLFAREEPEIRDLIVRLLRKQMDCILIDPYANAFNEEANGNCYAKDDTEMKPELWERKYEIDSLCFPLQLSWLFWKNTGSAAPFDEKWLQAARLAVRVLKTEQDHENASNYRFQRKNCIYIDTLSRDGKGALVKSGIGLTWSGFRPSDDACRYGYLIPANMLASVALREVSEIAGSIFHDTDFALEAQSLSDEIREAVETYAVVPGEEKEFYAYEVDGFGQYNVMDDANLPSLLAMPYFGYCSRNDRRYRNTREIVLSERNPYYYPGKVLTGIGSPHTKPRFVWSMALSMQGLTADSEEEKRRVLDMLAQSDGGTGLMHESVFADDAAQYTRPWFSWANSVFCEFVMDYLGYSIIM